VKFLVGVALGVIGMWAYRGGKVQSLVSGSPEPIQQAAKTARERINEVVTTDRVRQMASTVHDRIDPNDAPQIVKPTAAEVAGRPSEPLPRNEPAGIQIPSA
jgi:hypothetical protein